MIGLWTLLAGVGAVVALYAVGRWMVISDGDTDLNWGWCVLNGTMALAGVVAMACIVMLLGSFIVGAVQCVRP